MTMLAHALQRQRSLRRCSPTPAILRLLGGLPTGMTRLQCLTWGPLLDRRSNSCLLVLRSAHSCEGRACTPDADKALRATPTTHSPAAFDCALIAAAHAGAPAARRRPSQPGACRRCDVFILCTQHRAPAAPHNWGAAGRHPRPGAGTAGGAAHGAAHRARGARSSTRGTHHAPHSSSGWARSGPNRRVRGMTACISCQAASRRAVA